MELDPVGLKWIGIFMPSFLNVLALELARPLLLYRKRKEGKMPNVGLLPLAVPVIYFVAAPFAVPSYPEAWLEHSAGLSRVGSIHEGAMFIAWLIGYAFVVWRFRDFDGKKRK